MSDPNQGKKKDDDKKGKAAKYGKAEDTGLIKTDQLKSEGGINGFLSFSNGNDLTYFNIKNIIYVFTEPKSTPPTVAGSPAPETFDPTPKITFVLFYTKDIPDEDEEDTGTTKKPNEKDPPFVSIIGKYNIPEILKSNGIALVKINNLSFEPSEKSKIPIQPKTLIQAFEKVWERNYHPYHWFKERPRTFNQFGEAEEPKPFFRTELDNKGNPKGKPPTWRSNYLPCLVIYKGGFPVMIYEGPYGNQFPEDEDDKQNKENDLVAELFLSFLFNRRITSESITSRSNVITKNPFFSPDDINIPDVLQKETWDSIAKDLWFEYYKNSESVKRDVSGYDIFLTSIGLGTTGPTRLPAIPFIPPKKQKEKSLYDQYLASTYPNEEDDSSDEDKDRKYPEFEADNDVIFAPLLKPKGSKQPTKPVKLSSNVTQNMSQIITIPKIVSSPGLTEELNNKIFKIGGIPKIKGINKGVSESSSSETKPKQEGSKPEGSKPEGSKPEGQRPEGQRPEGQRPEGQRPDQKFQKPQGK